MKPLGIILGIAVAGVVIYLIIKRSTFIDRFPGGTPAGQSNGTSRDLQALVEPLEQPAILIRKTDGDSTSCFGGRPPAYSTFVWPDRDGRPLGFLGCVDLSQIGDAIDWLPRHGLLLFFYDLKEQPWGFDPRDRGAWPVLYVQDSPVNLGDAPEPDALKEEWKIPRQAIQFTTVSLPPAWEQVELAQLNLSESEHEALFELRDSRYGDAPHHQIGGFPDPIQSPDMDLECQLVSHGLYCGDPSGYQDPRAEQLKAGASDWRLLLQLDSDDDLDLMWGDGGMIYFWVRAEEASRGDFSNAWLILQCH